MANPMYSLNENFMYNSMLARALLQLVTVSERNVIQLWLEKMHEMDGSPEDMSVRNEYMWFLLLQLQNKRITQPYTKNPPTHRLRPLQDILPFQIYEEVLTSTEQNMSWMEKVTEAVGNISDNKTPPPSSHPSQFLQNQPTPRNGVICYFAAFSDQEY